jgi:oxygen-independent coproporphyrinogen-3 oxidase
MSREELTLEQRMLERVFLGLRRDSGIDLPAFRGEFGVDFQEKHGDLLGELRGLGLVEEVQDSLRLTLGGKLLADEVIGKFA